jgi:hypothetical protein
MIITIVIIVITITIIHCEYFVSHRTRDILLGIHYHQTQIMWVKQ